MAFSSEFLQLAANLTLKSFSGSSSKERSCQGVNGFVSEFINFKLFSKKLSSDQLHIFLFINNLL